jgi:hypothetical protein
MDIRRLFRFGERLTVRCRFRYRRDDPFAAGIDLIPATGMSGPRAVATTRAPTCFFSLDRPDGHVTFEADLPEIERWLESTYALVPLGSESELLDRDALTGRLPDRD